MRPIVLKKIIHKQTIMSYLEFHSLDRHAAQVFLQPSVHAFLYIVVSASGVDSSALRGRESLQVWMPSGIFRCSQDL